MSGGRRASAAGVALMLGGAGILLGVAAVPAQAAEVSYKTECIPPAASGLGPVEGTTKVEITAPATAKVGDEIQVVWKFVQAASKNPDLIVLPKDSVKPTGTLKASGAQTADIAMEGPQKNPEIPKGGDMVLSDMTGKVKLTTAGDVTLTPDAYTITAYSTDTKCTPQEAVPAAATIKVTAAEGGSTTSGGSTSGGTTTSGGTATGGDTGGTTSGGSTTSGDTTSGGTTSSGSTSGGNDGQTDFAGKTVTTSFACASPGPAKIDSSATINAKKNGGSYDLTVKTAKGVMNSPAPLPAGALKPSMVITVGGDDSGSLKVEGPANKDALNTGDPVSLGDMTGTYKPGADGKATLSPGDLTIVVTLSAGSNPITIPCKATKTAVSLELDVQKQAGGVSGATTSGSGSSSGSSSSSSGGGLAATGANDHGGLRALGFVAGTAILLGGAVFTFLPRRRVR
ncbi:hypothetical protein [Streptomyces mirabilis]|uniref:hypothetical protein n=1 Tax=Streptomyces mirabilis TaxID=68239 RepID=UPI0022546DAC|nr:hypothetical protein [Streptomyces mirabilis]MCX4423689.1 hypothetical protein [Streptomyces mirabilis]